MKNDKSEHPTGTLEREYKMRYLTAAQSAVLTETQTKRLSRLIELTKQITKYTCNKNHVQQLSQIYNESHHDFSANRDKPNMDHVADWLVTALTAFVMEKAANDNRTPVDIRISMPNPQPEFLSMDTIKNVMALLLDVKIRSAFGDVKEQIGGVETIRSGVLPPIKLGEKEIVIMNQTENVKHVDKLLELLKTLGKFDILEKYAIGHGLNLPDEIRKKSAEFVRALAVSDLYIHTAPAFDSLERIFIELNQSKKGVDIEIAKIARSGMKDARAKHGHHIVSMTRTAKDHLLQDMKKDAKKTKPGQPKKRWNRN